MFRSAVVVLGFVGLCITPAAFAEPVRAPSGGRPVLSGDVAYSDTHEKPINLTQEGLKEVLSWGEQLKTLVSSNGIGALPPMTNNGTTYLAQLYLYCTTRQGPCPFVLESILEADVIASRADGLPSCSLMKRFWKIWLSNSLEERGKFLYSVGHGLEMATFNSDIRPRFVACQETVSGILGDKTALEQRYGSSGTALPSVSRFLALIAQINESKIDVFQSTQERDIN